MVPTIATANNDFLSVISAGNLWFNFIISIPVTHGWLCLIPETVTSGPTREQQFKISVQFLKM